MGRGSIAWTWNLANAGLEIVVWELAPAAAGLMTDADRRARIRICANGPCDWMFLDTSRGGHRRWCRMGVCGNVSKVRRFRERQRGTR
jgi:predicted RNA-binding Zn ribbon-like protein